MCILVKFHIGTSLCTCIVKHNVHVHVQYMYMYSTCIVKHNVRVVLSDYDVFVIKVEAQDTIIDTNVSYNYINVIVISSLLTCKLLKSHF